MRFTALVAVLALAASPSFAQERRVLGGFQVGLNSFQGNEHSYSYFSNKASFGTKYLVDGATGFNIGGHVAFNLQKGHMIRVRLEETLAKGSPEADVDTSVVTLGVMGDYLFHPSGRNQGFYVAVGLGLEATAVKLDIAGFGDETSTRAAAALALGVGVQFTQTVGLELRYTTSKPTGYDFQGLKYDLNNDRLTLGLAFSF